MCQSFEVMICDAVALADQHTRSCSLLQEVSLLTGQIAHFK